MATASDHYILILCGGSGPRLWPLSRADHPKQFLQLLGERSLVQDTVNRSLKLVPSRNIFVVGNQNYRHLLRNQLSGYIPPENILTEPSKKNTMMAIIYAVSVINKLNPQAIITVCPSDHFVGLLPQFKSDIYTAYSLAKSQSNIVVIGIQPTSPDPSYGYILPGAKSGKYYPVLKFVEKPPVIDANVYIHKNALWNSGMYTFSIDTLQHQLQQHQVVYSKLFQQLINPRVKSLAKIYQQSPDLSIDKAISEVSHQLIAIPSHFQWSDIGEWQTIYDKLTKDHLGLAKIHRPTLTATFNSRNCLVTSTNNRKLIGLVGVSNLAVIDTPDAILVCNLNDSFSVRDLVTTIVGDPKLKKYFLSSYECQ